MPVWREAKGWRYRFQRGKKLFNKAWFETKEEALQAEIKAKKDIPRSEQINMIDTEFHRKHRIRETARRKMQGWVNERPNNCSKCNKSCKPDAHHPDYSKPLDVIWLCHSCHMFEHSKDISKPKGTGYVAKARKAAKEQKTESPCP